MSPSASRSATASPAACGSRRAGTGRSSTRRPSFSPRSASRPMRARKSRTFPMDASGSSRSRSRSASSRRCCCSMSPRPACRRRTPAASSTSLPDFLPISPSSSSSTTWTSCFASRSASPCSCRDRCWSKARRKKSRPMRACAPSISAKRMPDALRISSLRAGYGETVILEDIAFALPERGSLAVLGRNGVGKTTLLATIMGHTTFHAGVVFFSGRQVERLPVYERVRLGIGYVPQGRDIFASLSVDENLMVAARPGKRWTLERVYDLFPRLAERRHHRGNQISGGDQQMLAIGRALMGNPTLLLMDEPLEGLAPIIVEALLKSLERLLAEDELAVILVEQHAKLALQVTRDALVMSRGRVVHHGPSRELLADPERLGRLVVAQ